MAGLFGNFALGVNAANGHSRAMGVISQNLANASTHGYKASEARFQTLLTPGNGPASIQAQEQQSKFHGMRVHIQQQLDTQGALENTGRGLDLAITGRGFLTVEHSYSGEDAEVRFTRDGNFEKDIVYDDVENRETATMFLTNKSGNQLMGWNLADDPDQTGDIETIAIGLDANEPELPANPTSLIRYEAIVPSNQNPDETIITGARYYDGDPDGEPENMVIEWNRDGTQDNVWTITLREQPDGPAVGTETVEFLPPEPGSRVEESGQVNTPFPPTVTATLASGQEITVDFSDTAQYFDIFTPPQTQQDGFGPGDLLDVKFDDDGYLLGEYSNGEEVRLYRLPITYFNNDNGLEAAPGNDYRATLAAGNAAVYASGGRAGVEESQIGGLTAGALEKSTTNLEEEFSQLIQVQRAYQSATKIITTTDGMTQTTINTKQ